MTPYTILLDSMMIDEDILTLTDDEIGDDHIMTSVETPMHADAFKLTDDEKMHKIAYHFKEIMHTLGLDLTDDTRPGADFREPDRVLPGWRGVRARCRRHLPCGHSKRWCRWSRRAHQSDKQTARWRWLATC